MKTYFLYGKGEYIGCVKAFFMQEASDTRRFFNEKDEVIAVIRHVDRVTIDED